MNDQQFARAHNSYLEPPDVPDAEFCDECGTELELDYNNFGMGDELICKNPYCPNKFDEDVSQAMAIRLVETLEENDRLKTKLKRLTRNQSG